jgi:hypothetical protein
VFSQSFHCEVVVDANKEETTEESAINISVMVKFQKPYRFTKYGGLDKFCTARSFAPNQLVTKDILPNAN